MTLAQIPENGFFVQNSRIGVKGVYESGRSLGLKLGEIERLKAQKSTRYEVDGLQNWTIQERKRTVHNE